MNQEQRKYLIEQVEQSCRDQIAVLRNQIPDEPSMNNYLVAAFLDNSIQFNDINKLKEMMRNRVLKMGTSNTLINEERSFRTNYGESRYVKIVPEELFIIPEAYKEALKEYQAIKKDIEDKIDKLTSTKRTITMKIQIGSSAALEPLIQQIDNIADLTLVNTQLKLKE